MIRILVLVLAAANLLYWGWARWVREESPRLIAPGTATAASASPVTPAAEAPCAQLGPFAEEVRAMEVEQLLRDMRLQPQRRAVTTEVADGWWVYVPAADAAAQARTLRAIQGAGIEDASAMAVDAQLRVSVGLFTDETRAQARATAVRALRLEPVVEARMKRQSAFWVELPGTAPAGLDLARLGAEGVDIATLEVQDCAAAADDVSIDRILPTDAAPAEGG